VATSADANGIAMVSGDPQQGAVGTTLPQPLVVQVTDNFGNPIPAVTVDWSVTGGGSVSQSSTPTDDNGLASVQRTLGNTAGEQTTVATATGLAGSPVTFTHVATAGNASRVLIVSGNNQEGPPSTELNDPLVVEVLDENDNPIVGANVTWVVGTGDGSVDPQSNQTDGNGRSSVRWTLGAEPGPNVVNAVVSGVGVARFNATSSRASSTTRITAFNPEESIVGQRVAVTVAVTGSGGTPSGRVTVNGESVAQPCTITLSNEPGSCEIAFTASGNHRVTAAYSGDVRFQGSSDDDNYQVRAENSPPTAAFNPPSCIAGSPCQFNDGSSDSDGNIVAWTWNFGPGQSSDQKDPQHTFGAPGSYDVKLTVRDDDGATDDVTHQVAVTTPVNSPPTAFFNAPSCQVNVSCQFTDGSSDTDGQVVAWSWDFGDGSGNQQDELENPTHTYLGAETFTVTLVVTDDDNAVSTPFSAQVTVAP
jgi:PKD repeat protein